MAQFGELISKDKVMLVFVKGTDAPINHELVHVLGEKGIEVVKIEFEKNQELFDALRVTKTPEFMLYKNGQRFLRYSSPQEDLLDHLKNFSE